MTRADVEEYHSRTKRGVTIILALALTTLVVCVLSISASEIDIGVVEGFRILWDHLSGVDPEGYLPTLKDRVVFEQNVPRAIGAVCAGTVLAISGTTLQSLIRNPLADPYTLGISSGALFGMVLCVGLGFSVVPFISSEDAQIVNAFVFALIPTAVVIIVATFRKVTATMMVLCGIAVMYIFSALTTLIRYTADPEVLSSIYQWSIGSVSGLSWGSIPLMLLAVVVVAVPMMHYHKEIDIVAQGDEYASSLGINPNRLRIVCLILVSVSTAIIVCYTGTIGFLGLVAPHIARILVGSNCKLLIPCSAVIGSLMIIGSDVIVRLIAPSLPVGVIISLVCSPIFIHILLRMRKNAW